VLGLLVLVASIIATLAIAGSLLAPIRTLAAGAEALARGERVVLPSTGRDDELGRLVGVFNIMAAQLAELIQQKDRSAAKMQELLGELAQGMVLKEQQLRETALRNELSDLLHACIDMQEAGLVIRRYAPRLFPDLSGAVYLVEPATTLLTLLASWGDLALVDKLMASDCLALRRGKVHLVSAASSSVPCLHFGTAPVGASLCVPLIVQAETIGLLSLYCDKSCADGDDSSCTLRINLDSVEVFAPQISMALANLRLRTALREQAIRDLLTGLYNRRYLDESLDRELARAMRDGRPLAVFMLDVDHFKHFNDDHGHEAGDAVLRALGRVLRDNARLGDLPCRFGGEEFVILLPDANCAAAREWGERLMRQVRAMRIELAGVALPGITISLGLALYPEQGTDSDTLLQAADLALYDAKHAGRDRLVVSGEML
jgi:diguanylate cyclase (GGDEF)-like protein